MTQADVLTAIDDALDTGVATEDDPLTRELQELALALQADAPEPSPDFRRRMDRRVERGFEKLPGSRRPPWLKLLRPAPAIAVMILIALPLALIWNPSSPGGGDDGAGSEGGGMAAGGGGAESGAREQVPFLGSEPKLSGPADAVAGADAAPTVVLPPADRGFAPGRSNRKIERSIGLELEMPADEMSRVAEQVTTVTNRHGGFVLSSSVSTGEETAGGDFELRIPSAQLRPALRDLSALADVRSQTQTGRDVTREHVTAKDRLQAARAERRSLLRRLENATTDEQVEAIRVRLDLVASEINGLRGQLRDLRLRTDYAVVTVSLLPQEGGEDGDGGAGGSFDDALGDAGDLLVGFAGVLVRVLAIALPLALIALVGWLIGGTVRRRRRESALA